MTTLQKRLFRHADALEMWAEKTESNTITVGLLREAAAALDRQGEEGKEYDALATVYDELYDRGINPRLSDGRLLQDVCLDVLQAAK